MYKLVILVKGIKNQEVFTNTFIDYYVNQLLSLPGVFKVNVNPLTSTPIPDELIHSLNDVETEKAPDYFLQVELYFEHEEDLDNLLTNPPSLQLAVELISNAPGQIYSYIAKEFSFNKSQNLLT